MNFNDFDEYQKECKKTAIYPNIGRNFIYPVIGLAGETGEISEKIKKVIRDKKGKMDKETKMEIAKEVGDVMWYISLLSYELGMKLSDVIKINVEKINSRKSRNKIHGSGDNR